MARLVESINLQINLFAVVNQFDKHLLKFTIIVNFGLDPFVC